MRKTISLFLVVFTLLNAFIISSNAAGYLIFSDGFDIGFSSKNWQLKGSEFKWDSDRQCIYGYGVARVLETNYNAREPMIWDDFYTSFDVQICGFDDLEPVLENHTIGFWYRDLFENEEGAKGAVYEFFIEVETGVAYIKKTHTFSYRDENNILQQGHINNVKLCEGKIDGEIEVGEDAAPFNIGMRVTDGKIEGYFNEELVCTAEVDSDSERLGSFSLTSVDETVGSQKSPILFISGSEAAKLWIKLDNFKVWSPDYDVPGVEFGDVNGDGNINITDASFMLKHIAKWELDSFDSGAADVNDDSKVNLTDVAMVLKYIARWTSTSPTPES